MARKTLCTLSTDNLLNNLDVIKKHAPKAKITAMVKANAYGHGIRSVAKRLQGVVDSLGVAAIDEALALRQALVTTPITLIEGVFSPEELSIAADHNFSIVFNNNQQLYWLKNAKLSSKIHAWIKLNTGMGRLGFSPEEADNAWTFLHNCAGVHQPIGIVSHLACADMPQHPLTTKQIATFRDFAAAHDGPKSFANSAAIFDLPEIHYDWIRPGIALYGASPFEDRSAASLGLKPVMTFQTRLITVQHFKRGDTIGYGATYTCPEDMPIGIAAVGYGDGYPRSMKQGTPVLVNDERCPLVGRICMDMAAIDLRSCADALPDDVVTLWGHGLPIEDLLPYTDHLSYDLLSGIMNRVRFVWEDRAKQSSSKVA
ncbi:MAG: alanine racemase [Alphaproteobacteria bacterium]|nr:alanine racemase [Alphaproteobacteria bacterium]